MFEYSSRDSRRKGARPIAICRSRCSFARSPRIHCATVARSASEGCSSSSGGIPFDSISWRARNQLLPSADTSRSAVHSPSSFTPASGDSPPWQPAQRASITAVTFAGSPAAAAADANEPTAPTKRSNAGRRRAASRFAGIFKLPDAFIIDRHFRDRATTLITVGTAGENTPDSFLPEYARALLGGGFVFWKGMCAALTAATEKTVPATTILTAPKRRGLAA